MSTNTAVNIDNDHTAIDAGGHVYEVARKTGSSFFLPMQVLPEPRRGAILTLYAFCREVDDCVDKSESKEEAGKKLAFWREELANIYSGKALRHPLSSALSSPVDIYHMKRRYFEDMLDGFEMDCSGIMVRPSFSDLEEYCYRVAGCVGLLSTQIFGCHGEESCKFAVALGNALQLTNILRDIEEDSKMGRVYLPEELLSHYNLKEISQDIFIEKTEELDALCRDLAAKAGSYFGMTEAYVLPAEKQKLMPALLMRDVYRHFLQQMLEYGWPWQSGNYPVLGFYKKMDMMWSLLRYRWNYS